MARVGFPCDWELTGNFPPCYFLFLQRQYFMENGTLQSMQTSARNACQRLLAVRSRRPGRIPFARMRAGPVYYILPNL